MVCFKNHFLYSLSWHGSGTFVTGNGPEVDRKTSRSPVAAPAISGWARRLSHSRSIVRGRELVYDFRPGLPDLRSFPIEIWRRLAAHDLRVLSNDLGAYGDAAGQPRLRTAVAR